MACCDFVGEPSHEAQEHAEFHAFVAEDVRVGGEALANLFEHVFDDAFPVGVLDV